MSCNWLVSKLCRPGFASLQLTRLSGRRPSQLCRSISLMPVGSSSRVVSVELKERDLFINWNDSSSVDLPYVFLRDNCQEPVSFDQSAKQRLFNPAFTVDLSIKAKEVDVKEDGRQLVITWPDGHQSRFESAWLARYCRGKSSLSGRLAVEPYYWGSDYCDKMPRFDFNKLMTEEDSLLEFLLKLESHGLVLVESVGTESRQMKKLCDRIAFPKPTVYGFDVMKVESKPNPSHIAYSGVELPLHNDFVYYDYTSGIQLLHFIHQLPGPTAGASRFCDGINVAQELRTRNPAAFDMLSQYPIQFVDVGTDYIGDYDTESWHFPISVDKNGDVTGVAYSNHSRGPHFPSLLMDKLHDWYAAYYEFSHLMNSRDYLIEFKVQPGQMVVFNNVRVLHGRSEFKMTGNDYRYAELCYMDWDEIRSKARVLAKKLSHIY